MAKKKKQQGGYLKGPSHAKGGIAGTIAGQEPVELEGGEFIIKKSSAKKLGKKTLDELNKKGRIPAMAKGGKVTKESKTAKNLGISQAELTRLHTSKRTSMGKKKSAAQTTGTAIGAGELLTKAGRKKYLEERKKKFGTTGRIGKGESSEEASKLNKIFNKAILTAEKKKAKKKKQYGGGIAPQMGANRMNPQARPQAGSQMKPQGTTAGQSGTAAPGVATQPPAKAPFKQGMRTFEHGGEASVSNDKAKVGDIHTVHSHSGYKAGE